MAAAHGGRISHPLMSSLNVGWSAKRPDKSVIFETSQLEMCPCVLVPPTHHARTAASSAARSAATKGG